MSRRRLARAIATAMLALATLPLAACESKPPPNVLIAVLLASDQSPRWVNSDEPALRKRITQTCRGCEYVALNAQGDAQRQAEQLDQVLADGADAVILNAVDSEQAEELVLAAGNVPVIGYDRFVAGIDYFVSYDATATGTLQAQAVLQGVDVQQPAVLLINGGRLDANAREIRQARTQLFGKQVRVLAELEPQSWAPDEVAAWLPDQLRRNRGSIDAIVAANDNQVGAVVEALQEAGIKPRSYPFITGQDADLEAIRRIVRGEQSMTVYKPIVTEAEKAADIAVTLVTGGSVTDTVEIEGVPSFVFTPTAVNRQNLAETIVKDGLYSISDICDAATLPACERLGLR